MSGIIKKLRGIVRWRSICRKNRIEDKTGTLRGCNVKILGRDNTLIIGGGLPVDGVSTTIAKVGAVRGSNIEIRGCNNTLIIAAESKLDGSSISILGDACYVEIGPRSKIDSVHIWCQDNESRLVIGADFTQERGGLLAAMEGESVSIGNDCMFSQDVEIRNGDSHTIYGRMDNQRTNAARSVVIGDHVWIAAHARVLKGATIAGHTVLANSSVACGCLDIPYAIYSGIPAKLSRTNIDWDRARHWSVETKINRK